MMNKPNWDDAPEWAKYVAMDKDGEWWWFERKPVPEREEWRVDAGRVELASRNFEDWEDAIERRP